MNRLTTYIRESSIMRELAFFALYIVLIVLGLFVGLVVWREALFFVFYQWIALDIWWARFLYMLAVVVGAIALVAGLLVAEPYLHGGKARGQLLHRFLRVAVPLAVLGVVGWIIVVLGRMG
ncbi:MAG TPA: hypothetical protein VNL77_18310 [Roseiflexaceae bacterium]|nr:hypothetical protein [Roseiflexaceae bacterium]